MIRYTNIGVRLLETTYFTRTDKLFVENLRNILTHGTKDENPRPHYKDGNPAHTLFITDVYEKWQPEETPITSLRRIYWKTGIQEVLWLYQEATSDLQKARERGVKYWEEWKLEGEDSIGSVYGATVREYDLMNELLKGLEETPFGRRHIIDLWQYEQFKKPHGLKPCAFLTEWAVRKDHKGDYVLDMSLTQRSNDYILAGFINLTQYRALQMMVAKHLGYKVGTFSRKVMNLHIYDRHIDSAKRILQEYDARTKEGCGWTSDTQPPQLVLNVPDGTNFYDIKASDFEMKNYNPIEYKPSLELDIGI